LIKQRLLDNQNYIEYQEEKNQTLPKTRHCCILDVWALAQSCGVGHCSFLTPEGYKASITKIWFWFNQFTWFFLLFM